MLRVPIALEQDPETSRGVSWSLGECEVLSSLPLPVIDLWEPPNDLAWSQISLYSWVKWGHFNASRRQADGVLRLPVRSVREIGENLISMWFSSLVRLIF